MYLSETCRESTTGESAGKGDIRITATTSHHSFKNKNVIVSEKNS